MAANKIYLNIEKLALYHINNEIYNSVVGLKNFVPEIGSRIH